MLSRTAENLFWMARDMERAENTARMLDVNYQTSLLPQSADAAEKGWKGLLSISELSGDFARRYGAVNARNVMDYMVGDAQNPSSIRSCLMAARESKGRVRELRRTCSGKYSCLGSRGPSNVRVVGERGFLTIDGELYETDGTPAGTRPAITCRRGHFSAAL